MIPTVKAPPPPPANVRVSTNPPFVTIRRLLPRIGTAPPSLPTLIAPLPDMISVDRAPVAALVPCTTKALLVATLMMPTLIWVPGSMNFAPSLTSIRLLL